VLSVLTETSKVQDTSRLFLFLAFVPAEYLSRSARSSLVRRAWEVVTGDRETKTALGALSFIKEVADESSYLGPLVSRMVSRGS
jgi:hypothetical protein